MNMKRLSTVGAVLLLAVVTVGFAWTQAMPGRGPGVGRGPGRGPGMMGNHPNFDNEVEYLAMMIPHHQEAVDRSRELLEITQRAEMQQLLENIVEAQTREIGQMEAWLDEYYPGTEADTSYQPMMRDYAGLSADAADRVFIEDMQMHHMQAIMSSRILLQSSLDEHEEVAELAEGIIDSQLAEIELMQQMYRDWYGDDLGGFHGPGMMGW